MVDELSLHIYDHTEAQELSYSLQTEHCLIVDLGIELNQWPKRARGLRLLQWNADGLRNKISELE